MIRPTGRLYLDIETCGLHGVGTILQYAIDDSEIIIWNLWKEPIGATLDLLLSFTQYDLVGFNLSFDWFHACKLYTMWLVAAAELGRDAFPEDHINKFAHFEKAARSGPCLKPKRALDLLLIARSTEFQITMNRGDIVIKRIPAVLAERLAKHLNENVDLPDILFHRSLGARFKLQEIKKPDGNPDHNFRNIVLKFKPSAALKALAIHALKIPPDQVLTFGEIEPRVFPIDLGYAPFALALSKPEWGWKVPQELRPKQKKRADGKDFKTKVKPFAWPALLSIHIDHWSYNSEARQYATDDIKYTRMLDEYFGYKEPGNDDSELACMVGAVRWRGFAVDLERIRGLREDALSKIGKYPTAPKRVKAYLTEVLSETEMACANLDERGTAKVILLEISKWLTEEDCPFGPCSACKDTGKIHNEAAIRAQNVLDSRFARKEVELYDKILLAERLHADFNVIGALSSRMSGRGGLSMHSINREKKVRSAFIFADPDSDDVLDAGDFDGFEVTLADAVYKEPLLRVDLLTCEKCRDPATAVFGPCPKCGLDNKLKIHALFGIFVYPDMTYDEIIKTAKTPDDRYARAKSAVFAMLYGGEGYTLKTRLGVDQDTADAAYLKFCEKYPGIGRARMRIIDMFTALKQANGIGTAISFTEPADYIESLIGFRRYFTLENKLIGELFNLARHIPRDWSAIPIRVMRRDRLQTGTGAISSALYAAAFAIQSGNIRAAANHEIQSGGAQITKNLQRRIWDHQPYGANPWVVQPANAHDEILAVVNKAHSEAVTKTVNSTVESYRTKVPLISMKWGRLGTWADK